MAVIKVPAVLRDMAAGNSVVPVELSDTERVTLSDVFERIAREHPGLRDRSLDEHGRIRPHVNVFVNSLNVKDGDGIATLVAKGDEIQIIAAVSGGGRSG